MSVIVALSYILKIAGALGCTCSYAGTAAVQPLLAPPGAMGLWHVIKRPGTRHEAR